MRGSCCDAGSSCPSDILVLIASVSTCISCHVSAYSLFILGGFQSRINGKTGWRAAYAVRNAVSCGFGAIGLIHTNGICACAANRSICSKRTALTSFCSSWLFQIVHTSWVSSESSWRAGSGSSANACCQVCSRRSAAESGVDSDASWSAGSIACVNSSDSDSRMCANGSKSVLRLAVNSFFSHACWRSPAYSAIRRSLSWVIAAGALSGCSISSQVVGVVMRGAMNALCNASASADLRHSACL